MLLYGNLSNLFGQEEDFGWWNTQVGWDGQTHWSKYLTYSPNFFGANALPIPNLNGGNILPNASIALGADFLFSNKESVQYSTVEFYKPYGNGQISFFGSWIPVEYFSIRPETAIQRNIRDRDGKGATLGDLILGVSVAILRDQEHLPDVMLTTILRTALGRNREAARYTDAPGYSFDLSFGKDYNFKGFDLRPVGMVGLYVWQTNEDKNPQNDALLFGGGVQLQKNELQLDLHIVGYSGYKGNGDKPMASRIAISREFRNIKIKLPYEFRIRDFRAHQFGIELSWIL